MTVQILPGKPAGVMRVPPSKSMAHRLLVCAALARGASRVENVALSADIMATMGAMRALGAGMQYSGGNVAVDGAADTFLGEGSGRAADRAKEQSFGKITAPVDCGESGSTLRFLIPLFSLADGPVTFTGAARLFQRPLTVYEEMFREQGLVFAPGSESLTIQGPLRSGRYALAGNVSSQFISGLLFALPLLAGDSVIQVAPPFESRSYVELTRTAQAMFGVESRWQDENTLVVPGGQRYRPRQVVVEGDWSQAAVPAVIGAVCGGVSVSGLSQESMQGDKVILQILQRCGAEVGWREGLLTVAPGKAGLAAAGEVSLADCPDLGPVLCALALFCPGATKFVDAGRLRIKESDRIFSVESELKKLGGRLSSGADSIVVEGGGALLPNKTTISHNDHRVVMAIAVAAVCAGVPVTIEGAEAIQKSWPSFFEDLAEIGIHSEKESEARGG